MEDRIVERSESIQNFLESTAYRSTGLGLTRDTRATVDQVLDPKTIEVLQKMIKQGCFDQLAGCISTGKEANVYFGVREDGETVAVKVYKTSILGFRDRDEYVDGEYRFRRGYCKSNPRKMVSLWAEKEQRNLNRIHQSGIHCPRVIRCKRNVLVMTLIGQPNQAAPRLKDVAAEPLKGWTGVYEDVVLAMRKMFQVCRLVHGDLSEYNMLMDGETVAIIDVSQSVGVDHPRSLEFLKRDCLNVNIFFSRKLDAVIPLQDLFGFVIEKSSTDENERLADLMSRRIESSEMDADDSVFLQTWVPACLAEVGDMREVERLIDEKHHGLSSVFDNLLSTPECSVDSDLESNSGDSHSEDSDSEDSDRDGSEADGVVKTHLPDGHKPEDMTKQEWKKLVKEERREMRKNKVPKHLKHKRNLKKYGTK